MFRVRYVRFWHLADINPDAKQCPLLGVKQTSVIARSSVR